MRSTATSSVRDGCIITTTLLDSLVRSDGEGIQVDFLTAHSIARPCSRHFWILNVGLTCQIYRVSLTWFIGVKDEGFSSTGEIKTECGTALLYAMNSA